MTTINKIRVGEKFMVKPVGGKVWTRDYYEAELKVYFGRNELGHTIQVEPNTKVYKIYKNK